MALYKYVYDYDYDLRNSYPGANHGFVRDKPYINVLPKRELMSDLVAVNKCGSGHFRQSLIAVVAVDVSSTTTSPSGVRIIISDATRSPHQQNSSLHPRQFNTFFVVVAVIVLSAVILPIVLLIVQRTRHRRKHYRFSLVRIKSSPN